MDQADPAMPIVATIALRENQLNFMVDGQRAANDINNVPVTASGTTESDGTFTDEPLGGCATGPFNLSTFTQELFMSTNLTLLVRTNGWRFSGRFGCGNMTNGGDVNVSVPCQ